MKRQIIELNATQLRILRSLPASQGQAYKFWKAVCIGRGLDYTSMMTLCNGKVTALPIDHGKHWNFPYELKCKNPPPKDLKVDNN